MGPFEALYEDGLLKPETNLHLRSGERVKVIVLREPDPERWDLERLAATGQDEDVGLSQQGLAQWRHDLDREDRG